MKNARWILAAVLIGLGAAPDDSARTQAEKAIQAMRAAKGYRVDYQTRTQFKGTALAIKGSAVVVNPDIFFTHFTGSGGRELKIVRKGNRVLCTTPLYEGLEDDPLKKWHTPEEIGENDAGIRHNPDHVMTVLQSHLADAEAGAAHRVGNTDCLGVTLEFHGESIRDVMVEHGINLDQVDWKKSTLSCVLSIGKADSLVHQAVLKASLQNAQGLIDYEATFTLTDMAGGLELKEVPAAVLKELGIELPH